MKEAQIQYNSLLESGDLKELFPGLSGTWDKDKKLFTEMWKQNKEIIDSINTKTE